MTSAHALTPARPETTAPWRADLLLALLAVLVAFAVNASGGFETLTDARGDNDSLLRLVEVRDMLAGQGWFDLHQYRMGPEGGFVMHWSRLVDAPLALIILAAKALTGSMAAAETVARLLWPALLYGMTVLFIARSARRFGGESAVLPAFVIGAAGLHFIGIFQPGSLDHHNVQLMLTSASLYLLLEAQQRRWAALLAGVCAALMLAVGMETAPYIAAIGLCVSALYVLDGDGERRIARDFGLGLAGVSAIVFFSTIAPSEWGAAQCDAFSVFQFALAALAGAGLALVASAEAAGRTWQSRVLSLGLLGMAIAAVAALRFPECLSAPYSNLDPRLHELWLDHISEAQSLFQLIVDDPASVAARYVTPFVGLLLLALQLRRGPWRRQDSLVAAVLVMSFLVSVWQVRGSTFSIAFAVIPLSAWIGRWRDRVQARPSSWTSVRMIAVWLVSANASWMGAAAAASVALENSSAAAEQGDPALTCETQKDFAALAAMPATTVLAISNMGSPILAYSQHRVLAGPYHRNIAGDLLVLDAMMGTADAAKEVVHGQHVGLVAICRGSSESGLLTEKAPNGFLAQLIRGETPAWLEPLTETKGNPVEIFRVRDAG